VNDPRFSETPLNGCSGCRRDFASLRAFDAHRVGEHSLDFPEHGPVAGVSMLRKCRSGSRTVAADGPPKRSRLGQTGSLSTTRELHWSP
jgi:hypothetical protein